jgi:riboflavin synthase
MFTGLVEHIGHITLVTPTTAFEGYSFQISDSASILTDCSIGDSIAVNGCCLTVTEFDAKAGHFSVGLSNETLDRTDLGESRGRPARAGQLARIAMARPPRDRS